MSERISEEKIRDIRERTDIVEVVSSYLPLRRSGANHLGLCPFHGEKSPSFNVNATRQIFHCFGCGVGGNVFSFLMRMEGLSFPEAVRRLGERVGIDVEPETLTPAEEKRRAELESLARINEAAAEFYHQLLMETPEGEPARLYLKERGYGRETARRFRLGFAPERWDLLGRHLAAKGFDPVLVRERLGLTRAKREGAGEIDLFRRRLLFPIIDLQGKVAAFGGRVLDDALPKYINSPESPLYHKGRILYGLYQAREEMRHRGEGIVVEGYFDLLALHRAGVQQVAATCGTALTADHAKLLKRYASRVLLLFDQDAAGRKATFRAMEPLLAEGLSVAVIDLDPGEDPDSFLRLRGAEAFAARLAAARPVFEVFMEAALAAHGEGVEGRARAAEEILAKLRLVPSPIERDLYRQALARRTGLDLRLLTVQAQAGPGPAAEPARRPPAADAPRRLRPGAGVKAQDLLLQLMLADAGLRRRVAAEGAGQFFPDPERRAIAAEILRAGAESGETVDEQELCDRLDEEPKAILSGILMKGREGIGDDPERVFDDCRREAEREPLKQRLRELDLLLREAAGDAAKQAELLAEKAALNRQLKK